MKKLSVLLTLLVLIAGMSFAWPPMHGGERAFENREEAREWFEKNAKEVELTGIVALEDFRVVFKVDGKSYAIHGPGMRKLEIGYQNGDQITIKGILLPTPDKIKDAPVNGMIKVQSLSYKGKEYIFASGGHKGRGCPMAGNDHGKRSGRKGRRGRSH